MFTGIIEEMGKIRRVTGDKLEIEAEKVLEDLKAGDSISVNGVCLTVSAIAGKVFAADVMPETREKTVLDGLRPSDKVNLERALRGSDRLGGHFVTGHVDGTGSITSSKRRGNSIIMTIAVPEKVMRYLVDQGAIAIDGISLTVQALSKKTVTVAIIPRTAAVTTLGTKNIGSKVNVEVDTLAKYVQKFLERDAPEGFPWDTLGQIEEGG
jgi:riboflavin synthase